MPALEEAARQGPDHAEAHCNLGHALQNLERYAEAVRAFGRGHELGLRQSVRPYDSAGWLERAEALLAGDE